MPDIIKELYDKICTIDTLEEYQNVIPDSIEKMEAAGYKNMADKVRVLSEVYINRFSKQATLENFKNSKKKVMDCLRKESCTYKNISD